MYSAKENAEALNLEIEFCCSDLFSSVSGRFDVIAFNAPYIDIEKGKVNGTLKDELSEKRFSGGVVGGETISRFIREAPEHISEGGKVLLGVNHYHIKRPTLLSLINKSDFDLQECIENPFIPATVYVLY